MTPSPTIHTVTSSTWDLNTLSQEPVTSITLMESITFSSVGCEDDKTCYLILVMM